MSSSLEPHELERLLKEIPLSPAPGDLWDEVSAELRDNKKAKPSFLRRPVRSPLVTAAAITIAAFGGMYVGALRTFSSPVRWEVVPVAGSPFVGDEVLDEPGNLEKGQWLVTDAQSRARLSIGRIGTAEIGPNSRVRLDSARAREHRLTLEHGSLDAIITAPPRLFFVKTPATLATDLGCAYTLTVDSLGTTRIHVTSGWVELKEGRRVSLVPEGFVANVEMGGEPGTPYAKDLPDDAQEVLWQLDRGSGDSTTVLRLLDALHPKTAAPELRKESAITLWHLLHRLEGDLRELVLDSMIVLSPPPPGITREGILALERPMLERWRRDLRPMWSEEAQPLLVRVARRLWEWTMS